MLLEKQRVEIFINLMNVRFKTVNINFFFCIGRIYSRKKNLTKKNNINYIHYLQYTEVILLEKQINSSTIAYLSN